MIAINELKNGMAIVLGGEPYSVLEVKHQHVGRGAASVSTRLKNLRTGQVTARNFKPADKFEEADIKKERFRFLYGHRGLFWFSDPENPKNRFSLGENVLGGSVSFLKAGLEVVAVKFGGEIIGVELPVKADFKVIEAPPAVRGDTAQGGTKTVVIETGAKVVVPLFVGEGDIIRVNTATGEYAERVGKSA